MAIKTQETKRQLSYAMQMAEKLEEMLSEYDEEFFDPVALAIANGIVKRIKIASDLLNYESGVNE